MGLTGKGNVLPGGTGKLLPPATLEIIAPSRFTAEPPRPPIAFFRAPPIPPPARFLILLIAPPIPPPAIFDRILPPIIFNSPPTNGPAPPVSIPPSTPVAAGPIIFKAPPAIFLNFPMTEVALPRIPGTFEAILPTLSTTRADFSMIDPAF